MPGPLQRTSSLIEAEYNVFTIGGPDAFPGSQVRPYDNGLVSATPADPHTCAVIVTGIYDGDVHVTAETWRHRPPVPDLGQWQDVIEISVAWPGGRMQVIGADVDPPSRAVFGDAQPPGGYRMRVAGRNRDDGEARTADLPPEQYLVQVWPGPPAPDRVFKATSETAAYWAAAGPPRG
ncbi:hypothetical protein ILP97_46525 [Amycolatopsis sp. H6(2020)]|nr:hypothetical protein [Amycolatopsis sp. H6(2020)]